MKQKRNSKKKKNRSSATNSPCGGPSAGSKKPLEKEATDIGGKREAKKENFEDNVIESLRDAFCSVSIEEATAAYKEAGGDPDKAAEILSDLVESVDDPFTSSVSSGFSGPETGSSSDYGTGSSSSVSDGFMESGYVQNLMRERGFKGSKQNRVIAATGTVSTVIGKEYMKQNPVKKEVSSVTRFKGVGENNNFVSDMEEAEQFISSMLGDDCELSMAVIRDILCQCGYNVDKALDVILDMSSSSSDTSFDGRYYPEARSYKEDRGFSCGHSDSLAATTSNYLTYLPRSELDDNFWTTNCYERNYARVLASSEGPSTSTQENNELDLPHKVLKSLFNIPQSPRHEPDKMNWRNVVKKLQSLGSSVDACSSDGAESQLVTCVKDDGYHELRKGANKQWNATKTYYQRAAQAYSKGERAHAAYLSDQGRTAAKLAHRADEQASQDIFVARNRDIENVITIDLHGQHVKQAMRLLKLHLLFGSYVPSVRTLRVITGCGSHGIGKSKVKQSVVKLLEREGVRHWEENRGTLIVRVEGCPDFGFVDSDRDSEED